MSAPVRGARSRDRRVAPGAAGGFGPAAAAVARALARRPDLVVAAVSALLRLARPRWWARPPFLPVPDEAYWRFRMVTAFGGEGGRLTADDVIAYLQWCRRMPAAGG